MAHQGRADPVNVHVLAAARLTRRPHFLRQDESGPGIRITAAPLLRPVRHQQSRLRTLSAELLRESRLDLGSRTVSLRLPVLRQVVGQEIPDGVTERLLLAVPVKIHQVRSTVSGRKSKASR